ncbi:MAG: sulfate adenylyltransferase subunit CysN [Phycisphaera sp.]|nr:sulfate adenylyltransferase subunit CysN [Phycisphaera sp.]
MDPRFDVNTDTIDEYLARHEGKQLLRFLTCGSVDDGKSTLIGRLLHDTKGIYEDQLAAVEGDSRKYGTQGGHADLALLVDGLRSEREQGITIDVAYRYFSTEKRKFIVADTPGHEQYTRNMATGASTCDLAVLLVDARHGVSVQTRRHCVITSLLGIPKIIVAINKMDLVDWDPKVFESIKADFESFSSRLPGREQHFVPMSALEGEVIVEPSPKAPWYDGPCFLELLESIEIGAAAQETAFRMPVSLVIRPDLDYRGFGGRIESGVVRPGDRVKVLPAGTESKVARISTFDGDLEMAGAPRSVAIVLEDEIDASRGDVIVAAEEPSLVSDRITADLVWMHEDRLSPGREFILRHGTRVTPCRVRRIVEKLDIDTLDRHPAESLELNEIGRVELETDFPLAFDPYERIRGTGSLILVDRIGNWTMAAGMIRGRTEDQRWTAAPMSGETRDGEPDPVSPAEREARYGQRPATILLTGLAGSGKTRLAALLERALFDLGRVAIRLDGTTMRRGLNRDLGFTAADRSENLRRSMETAKLVNDEGLLCIAAFVAPLAATRKKAAELVGDDRFFVVHCSAPLDHCRTNDSTGLYAEAEAKGLKDIPGVDLEYEPPVSPDVLLPTHDLEPEESVNRILDLLRSKGILR